ncbi:site-specific DNA-methyltransferase [Meridianimarinicoccus roseus]|uniref:site-specific DNA-methyltransferase (adenine-specific) n=1 Tax=Meridianimarinicoccus roseus TaxID=2072018 RepID=A0A2V2L7E4_9RHOB|nr:site-specific DNA-methyltransferase [Meridianimarinicoccus roseus]PWR01262.1 site-specific DNA-methyltransferase [Meridianimarinicoccus roseus]
MDKLKMHSPDLSQDNIAKIRALFPGCVTEARDEATGAVRLAVDFDQLRQELSDHIVEGPQERYRLDWPGKREALLASNAPIAKTLRPSESDSVDFLGTHNLFIEGDNLEALKVIQETYLGKVKLIYVDPPYNTGRDFVYDDDFAENAESFMVRSMQTSASGDRLVANPESNGRFHSDWLTMMYSRIRLAKTLLSEDGVFLTSIDDGEVSNIRKICDEIFGENHFAAQIIWKKRNTPPNDRVIGAQHDYILVYFKNDLAGINLRPRTDDQIARYKNPDDHPKGPWVVGDLTANVKGGRFSNALYYPITNPNTGEEFYPPNNGNWRFNKDRIERLIASDEIYFGKDGTSSPKLKRFLCDVKDGATWTTLWDFAPFNTSGTNEMRDIFGNSVLFENPKPIGLLEHIVDLGASSDALVMDFFAGSGTTAHAVLKKNSEDGGSRRFIMVQLPEATNEDSEAHKAGYKTIAEVSKERIRRAGKKILEGECHPDWNRDVGFRVLKVDTSNMKDVYYRPDELKQSDLLDMVDNVKEGRTAEDLLFQVLVDWGVDLTLPIRRETVQSKTVFFVDDNALVACFDRGVTEDLVKELAGHEPLRVVFRDNGFVSDAVKINVEQIFRQLSPTTDVKSI